MWEDDDVRVMDDRSRNGIHVNGEPVEGRPLVDGDAIAIGRHTLFFLDTTATAAPAATAAAAAE